MSVSFVPDKVSVIMRYNGLYEIRSRRKNHQSQIDNIITISNYWNEHKYRQYIPRNCRYFSPSVRVYVIFDTFPYRAKKHELRQINGKEN